MISIRHDTAFDLNVYVARCDDCGAVVASALSAQALQLRLRQVVPDWRPGCEMPLFCPDQRACSDRCWEQWGHQLQRQISQYPAGPVTQNLSQRD